jgi:hypothetical protein
MRRADPYYDEKVYHFAAGFSSAGTVSALCYKKPQAIKLDRGQSWTIRPNAVTCPKCRKALRDAAIL